MKIGIDFDDVLIEFMKHLGEYHNTHYGTSHTREDFSVWNLWETWGIDEEESYRRVSSFMNSVDHDKITPMEGAREVVELLSKDHTLYLITARDSKESVPALYLLTTYFAGMFSGIHFLYKNGNKVTDKGALSKALGIDLFIDDSESNCTLVAREGITTLIFDAPWNRKFSDEGIQRVHSWKEVLERIKEM